MVGVEGSWGQETLGLDLTVAQTVIAQVGNYGEIYDRHLGSGGLDLPREGGRSPVYGFSGSIFAEGTDVPIDQATRTSEGTDARSSMGGPTCRALG